MPVRRSRDLSRSDHKGAPHDAKGYTLIATGETSPEDLSSQRFKQVMQDTTDLLDHLASGEYRFMYEAIGEDTPLKEVEASQKELWTDWERRLGNFVAVETWGSRNYTRASSLAPPKYVFSGVPCTPSISGVAIAFTGIAFPTRCKISLRDRCGQRRLSSATPTTSLFGRGRASHDAALCPQGNS